MPTIWGRKTTMPRGIPATAVIGVMLDATAGAGSIDVDTTGSYPDYVKVTATAAGGGFVASSTEAIAYENRPALLVADFVVIDNDHVIGIGFEDIVGGGVFAMLVSYNPGAGQIFALRTTADGYVPFATVVPAASAFRLVLEVSATGIRASLQDANVAGVRETVLGSVAAAPTKMNIAVRVGAVGGGDRMVPVRIDRLVTQPSV